MKNNVNPFGVKSVQTRNQRFKLLTFNCDLDLEFSMVKTYVLHTVSLR